MARDTGPLESKKFILTLFAMLTSKAVMLAGLILLRDNVDAASVWMWWWMITLTIIDGFFSTGAVLGIAYVDKFVRVAEIVAKGPPSPGAADG